jgi:hypothetical protein
MGKFWSRGVSKRNFYGIFYKKMRLFSEKGLTETAKFGMIEDMVGVSIYKEEEGER